jgi:hypothetical protein
MDNLGKNGRSLMDNWGKIRQSLIFYFVAIDPRSTKNASRNFYSPGAQNAPASKKDFLVFQSGSTGYWLSSKILK